MTPTLARLAALDRALTAHGWPALSPWWRATFERFVASSRRQLVIRAGRRAGKSSSLCRFAVAFALAFDARLIPPGDVGVVAFISTTRDEASQRLRTIRAILDALGIPWRPIEHGLELVGRAIAFKVFVATIAGVSGPTAILVVADEVAKWKDADTGANPATEVLASVRPAMATIPSARIVLSSSPLGKDDAHAKAFDLGDTDHQITAYATSWDANPILSEAELRRDEPDPRVFSREYRAIPQAATLAAFDAAHVARAFEPADITGPDYGQFGVIDASSGKKDTWAWLRASWRGRDRASRRLVVAHVDGIGGSFWAQDAGDRIVARVADDMTSHGARTVYGDQRESLLLASAFTRHGLRFIELPWTAPRKERAVMVLRRWLADGVLSLPPHDGLRSELLSFEEKITSTGAFTFAGGRGTSGRDDYVALLLTAAMADSEPRGKGVPALPGSPTSSSRMVEALLASVAQQERYDPEAPPSFPDVDRQQELLH